MSRLSPLRKISTVREKSIPNRPGQIIDVFKAAPPIGIQNSMLEFSVSETRNDGHLEACYSCHRGKIIKSKAAEKSSRKQPFMPFQCGLSRSTKKCCQAKTLIRLETRAGLVGVHLEAVLVGPWSARVLLEGHTLQTRS